MQVAPDVNNRQPSAPNWLGNIYDFHDMRATICPAEVSGVVATVVADSTEDDNSHSGRDGMVRREELPPMLPSTPPAMDPSLPAGARLIAKVCTVRPRDYSLSAAGLAQSLPEKSYASYQLGFLSKFAVNPTHAIVR